MAKNFCEALSLTVPPVPFPATFGQSADAVNHPMGERRSRADEWESPAVAGLIRALETRDACTGRHSRCVADIALFLAERMGCPSETQRPIYIGALLHDIGKIGMDDAILRKDGQLTPRELDCIKKHPQLGCAIVKDIEPSDVVLSVVLHHHENWDGSGYPLGLRGSQIPRAARFCALADAFDAMSSDRSYRRRMPAEKVDDIVREGTGKQWDPEIVELYFGCRHAIRRGVFHHPTGHAVKTHAADLSHPAMHGPSRTLLPELGIGQSITVTY